MHGFDNPSDAEIKGLLNRVKVIAVVGLSPKPQRPSHRVATHLQRYGYHIIPVRPRVETILGESVYPTLEQVPVRIDLVDVFRVPQHIAAISR